MAFLVITRRCLGAVCGRCYAPANIWFESDPATGKARVKHQPEAQDVPAVRQLALGCQASPTAIMESEQADGPFTLAISAEEATARGTLTTSTGTP